MQHSIMIADDSIPLHALIKAQLDSDDLIFHSVYDGTAAVSAATSIKPDLILLDIDMPNMDGFEACQKIKADPATAAIPLMFLSAEPMLKDKAKAMALGAFGYLQKPFRPEQLKSAVHSKLRAMQTANQNELIDPATGLWNKDYFEVQLREQFILANLSATPLSCALMEIDQLDSINVRFGSKTSNRVRHEVARILSEFARPGVTVCSLPNRRFAMLFRNRDRFEARKICRELKSQIRRGVVIDAAPPRQVTCSFGVCDSQVATAMTLFERTLNVLQRAADQGGDRIALSRSHATTVAQPVQNEFVVR